MIKQEITYYKGTMQEKTYKEFSEGKLILSHQYDDEGLLIETMYHGDIIYRLNSDKTFYKWCYTPDGEFAHIMYGKLNKDELFGFDLIGIDLETESVK